MAREVSAALASNHSTAHSDDLPCLSEVAKLMLACLLYLLYSGYPVSMCPCLDLISHEEPASPPLQTPNKCRSTQRDQ